MHACALLDVRAMTTKVAQVVNSSNLLEQASQAHRSSALSQGELKKSSLVPTACSCVYLL